jgi:Uma2 family endonuclease
MSVLTAATPHAHNPVTPPPAGAPGPRPIRWSVEQYYKLGELGFFQGKRVELVRGEIIEMSPMGWQHSLACTLVLQKLFPLFSGGFFLSDQKPFSLADSEPEPDFAIIPGSPRDYSYHPPVASLVVEVSDTTLFYDTTTKAELYATAGVPEYWVLDLDGKRLLVFRDPEALPTGLGATAYRTHLVLSPTETISPLASPNSTITVSELLP